MRNTLGCLIPPVYGGGEFDKMTKENMKNKQKNFVSLVVVVLLAVLMVMPVGVIKAWPF